MLFSMTGFGQAERSIAGFKLQIDLKSVNHRYCEIVVRMPREWAKFEDTIKRTVSQQVKRGRVDAFISMERDSGGTPSFRVDAALAESYMHAAEQLRSGLSLQDELKLSDLLQIPNLIVLEDGLQASEEEIERALTDVTAEATRNLLSMREREGEHLLSDLKQRLLSMRSFCESAAFIAPQAVKEFSDKLRLRMQELLQSAALDESRLAMEAAIFADRASVDEELTRLQSHFQQFEGLLQAAVPVGRKLDFLVQEMNREVNTIGSKANHARLTSLVVEMKAELEKMREQIQNIE
ncbi:YicC family protein [Paenibacillus filicis]|uniref:YicC family protein n=1 Tax=Paenibacillus gyeongsangnamensis TaxID=3388067 RepID=A0ABT4Q3G8_9BACL|nr:YicC/YloC family endoribonuclease [Paenibacillus filicis]MCZ8511418.1 YicC family protein [Paenibacillus filicis]